MKFYPVKKLWIMLMGLGVGWFGFAIIAIMYSSDVKDKSGVIFLGICFVCLLVCFFRLLQVKVFSDGDNLYFPTFIKTVRIRFSDISSIRMQLGKTGYYYVLKGKDSTGKEYKINLGILKDKQELIKDVVAKNPAVKVD